MITIIMVVVMAIMSLHTVLTREAFLVEALLVPVRPTLLTRSRRPGRQTTRFTRVLESSSPSSSSTLRVRTSSSSIITTHTWLLLLWPGTSWTENDTHPSRAHHDDPLDDRGSLHSSTDLNYTATSLIARAHDSPASPSSSRYTSSSSSSPGNRAGWRGIPSVVVVAVGYPWLAALLWISWEDLAVHTVWPAHRSFPVSTTMEVRIESSSSWSSPSLTTTTNPSGTSAGRWGQATVQGLGFGQEQRLALAREQLSGEESSAPSSNRPTPGKDIIREMDDSSSSEKDPARVLMERPSYNEIMWQHRHQRVARWREESRARFPSSPWSSSSSSSRPDSFTTVMITPEFTPRLEHSVGVLLQCLHSIHPLMDLARDYQWDGIHQQLHARPWIDLQVAASQVRSAMMRQAHISTSSITGAWPGRSYAALDSDYGVAAQTIGFDWGSCAWRHCGALADAQEALDELEHLLGVLEPYEVIFCLDIVERSLRDMLLTLPWPQLVVSTHDTTTTKAVAALDPIVSPPGDDSDDYSLAALYQQWQSIPPYSSPSSQSSADDSAPDLYQHLEEEYRQTLQILEYGWMDR